MKTVLITGSEGQLGRAYVLRLLELGYQVVGIDTLPEPKNNGIQYFQADITKPNEINDLLGNLNSDVDVLINNAGVMVFTPFEERTEEELDYIIDVNLKGTIFVTQSVFNRFFVPKKKGCIVNIGSVYGVVAGDMSIYREGERRTPEIYGATKAAVIHLTKYFAAYMAPYNVRVNCISPGGIFNDHKKEFVDRYSAKVPMKRMGNEQELLSTLELLISDKSSYLTGQNIIVDGGLSAW
ncbi:MAG: SDR family oxidoreductase [Candidatus Margulisiibacteriota bacterium]